MPEEKEEKKEVKKESKANDGGMNIGEVFSKSWELLTKNITMFVLVALIGIGLTLIPIIIATFGGVSVLGVAMSVDAVSTLMAGAGMVILLLVAILGLFVSTWTVGASTYAAYNAMTGKKVTAWDNYKMALKKFWIFLGVSIVVGIIVSVGMLLLVIPGVIALIFLAYTFYLVVAENLGTGKAISRSFELAKKNWATILVAMILLALISTVLSWIPLINFIIVPVLSIFGTLVIACLYERVK